MKYQELSAEDLRLVAAQLYKMIKTIRLEQPSVTENWSKTFEQAQQQGELPAWRI